jgi:hypothetical protein
MNFKKNNQNFRNGKVSFKKAIYVFSDWCDAEISEALKGMQVPR